MNGRRQILGALAQGFRILSGITDRLPFLVAIVLFASPVGPHLRWTYQYQEAFGQSFYTGCSYVGSRGLIASASVDGCPFLAWLDTREYRP